MTDEERYAEAERIRDLFPDGLLAFLLTEVEGHHAENYALHEAIREADYAARRPLSIIGRLRTQNAAMREIVQAVATGGTTESLDDRIRYRLQYVVYVSDEMRDKARALLAMDSTSGDAP